MKERTAIDRFQDLVENVVTSRAKLFQQFIDPRRNYDQECGHPETPPTDPQYYRAMYDLDPIASRVVELMPKECWQIVPDIFETEDEEATPFEKAVDGLAKHLRGGKSWYQDQNGSPMWEKVRRADIASGIGRFGIMLLGFDDGLPYDQPVAGAEEDLDDDSLGVDVASLGTDEQYQGVATYDPGERPAKRDGLHLLFMRSFDESLVQISSYDANQGSPRYGQPVMYLVTLNDPKAALTGIGLSTTQSRVHWSRVIHLADNRVNSDVAGTPRAQHPVKRILDLQKLYGGSAEMYWRGAFPGLSIETVPQLGGDVIIDKAGLRDEVEAYMQGLQRTLTLMGMSAKSLAPQVSDPSQQIAVQIEAICITLGCPVRVFKGSERGELASSQDDASWNDRIRERQNNYLTPLVIVPLIDRLIAVGVLPEPKGYSVSWPDLTAQSDADKANVGLVKVQTAAAYIAGNVESIIPPHDLLTRYLDESPEAAESMLDEAKKAALDNPMTMPPTGELGHPATPEPKPVPPKPFGQKEAG